MKLLALLLKCLLTYVKLQWECMWPPDECIMVCTVLIANNLNNDKEVTKK